MPFSSSRRFKQERQLTTIVIQLPTEDISRIIDYTPLYADKMPRELHDLLWRVRKQLTGGKD